MGLALALLPSPGPAATQDTPPEAASEDYLRLGSRLTSDTRDDDIVVSWIGGFGFRFEGQEMRARRAVCWLDPHVSARLLDDRKKDPLHAGPSLPGSSRTAPMSGTGVTAGDFARALREVYLEGGVTWRRPDGTTIHAESLYFHVADGHGRIRHADLYHTLPEVADRAPLRLHLRADEFRAEGGGQLVADHTMLTTCDYAEPHYHLVAGRLLWNPQPGEGISGRAVAAGNHVRVGDIPVLPLPRVSLDVDRSRTALPLKKARAGQSTRLGAFVQTLWGEDVDAWGQGMHERLGIDAPFEGEVELDLDFMSRRGLGVGPGLVYQSPGLYRGEIGTYFLRDRRDEDRSNLSRAQAAAGLGGAGDPLRFDVDQPNRLKAFTRNRIQFDEAWRFDAEAHYYSDAGFQREFFEKETKEEKEPESYGFLVRQEGTSRFGLLYRNKLLDFDTQLDALPRLTYDEVARPLFRLPGFSDDNPVTLVMNHATELAHLRRNPADQVATPSDRLLRGDSMLELSAPMALGPFGLRPFVAGQLTGWTETANDGPSMGRVVGATGARLQLPVHRTYAAQSDTWSLDGLRHVMLYDVGYENRFAANRDPMELVQLDPTDALTKREYFLVGWRHRLQTWRQGHMIDFLEADLEIPLYPDEDRDNPVRTNAAGAAVGRTAGPVRFDVVWRPGLDLPLLRNAVLLTEGEWDLTEERFESYNAAAVIRPSPRWSTLVSWRTVRDRSRVLTGAVDWRLTERWALAFLDQRDLRDDGLLEQSVSLRHYGHDFLVEITVSRDRGDDNTSAALSLTPILMGERSSSRRFSERGAMPSLIPNDR